ncbi:beta-lactamase family protein [Verrucomicrobia bacterium]|nr:beta-lactamase family protein [Verrucomicrobiota bacterium]MDC0144547.1 beta-lactamase family protein [Verrucomicrobiota bacterium]
MKQTFIALMALIVAIGCQTSPERISQISSKKNPVSDLGGDSFPEAPPESQGIPSGVLERLSELVAGFVEAEEIVGAELLIIKNRRTVMHEVFGHDDRRGDKALVKNTIFSIRSMTKPLTGAVAQMLIEDGVLKLTDPVAKYLDSFDNKRSRGVTIEHLLTHRSGFPMKSAGTLWSNYSSYTNIQQVANYWGEYGPQLFTPGERYQYADANVDTLGAVIEVANGKPAETLIEQRLFEKLGMRDTITLLREGDLRVERVAGKHAGGRGRWNQFWRWNGKPYFSFPMFAQSFYSTPVDYARFLGMVMDGGIVNGQRLLSDAAIARMLMPVSKTTMPTGFAGLESSYGQLMHLYDKDGKVVVFGHSGSDGTYAWAWPAQDLMVLYFTQSRGSITMNRMEAVIDSLLARPVLDQKREE